jgi:hypothetical protein
MAAVVLNRREVCGGMPGCDPEDSGRLIIEETEVGEKIECRLIAPSGRSIWLWVREGDVVTKMNELLLKYWVTNTPTMKFDSGRFCLTVSVPCSEAGCVHKHLDICSIAVYAGEPVYPFGPVAHRTRYFPPYQYVYYDADDIPIACRYVCADVPGKESERAIVLYMLSRQDGSIFEVRREYSAGDQTITEEYHLINNNEQAKYRKTMEDPLSSPTVVERVIDWTGPTCASDLPGVVTGTTIKPARREL